MSLTLPIQHKEKEELFMSIMQEEGISELNTYQTDTINRGLLDDNNFIISSPTASGKTLMAKFAAQCRYQ